MISHYFLIKFTINIIPKPSFGQQNKKGKNQSVSSYLITYFLYPTL